MNRFIGCTALALCAALSGCMGEKGEKGDTGPVGPAGPAGTGGSSLADRQIRIELAQYYYGYTNPDTSAFIIPLIYKFNKMNYPGVDSIVFTGVLHTSGPGSSAIVELHNVSEHTPIAGSRLETTSTSDVELNVGDLYDAIPAREFTLGIRLRSSDPSKTAYLTAAALYLYRK